MTRGSGIPWLAAVLALGLPASAGTGAPGRPAPHCELTSLDRSEPYDLQQLRGRVLYVDFWASWCAPCVEAFPFLNRLQREFGERGLQVLGINVDEDPRDALAFLAGHPAAFLLAASATGQCPRDFGVDGMPTSFLVDREGVIRLVHEGFRPGEAGELRARVEELLAEAPPGPAYPAGAIPQEPPDARR